MACTKNTYPVDLKETNNICDITCNLSFDYNNSSNFSVDNYNGIYLNINYEEAPNPNVTLSSSKFTANQIRIFTPSLHKYNGKYADAELLINHTGNNNKNLIISIPIKNEGYLSNSSNTLARIIGDMANSRINNFTDPLIINNYSLNCNNLVPEKPFFYYEGCSNNPNFFINTNVKIIAFNYVENSKSSGAIIVDNKFMTNLKALLTNPNKISTVNISSTEILYNQNGPSNSKKENIYIDCQPTNEDGEIYTPLESGAPPNLFSNIFKSGLNNKEMSIIKGLLGLFVMFIILYIAKILMEKIVGKLKKFDSFVNSRGG